MYIFSNYQVKSLLIGFLGTLFLLSSCSDSSNPGVEEAAALAAETEQMDVVGELALKNTSNDVYRYSTEIPEDWTETTHIADDGSVIINMYQEDKIASVDLPITIQSQPAIDHIDLYPKGLNTKFPYGENLRLSKYNGKVPVAGLWDEDKSRVFLLGNGEVWAYLLYPEDRPNGWEKDGFIFAQIAIDNFSSESYDEITADLKELQIWKPIA
ncbi:MAG: hypothetical protein KDD15_13915, partial [Lewinella sp.]|nr:hypothetical protein [Lewinella sp.]